MINKVIYFVVLILSFTKLSAQTETNESEIFKMQLFLNKKSFKKSNQDTINNVSLSYKMFSDLFVLKMNELNVENSLLGNLETNYVFYKVQESEIMYKRKLSNDEYRYFDIECYPDYYYILAINLNTGASYRLAGFESNDFITFFIDFRDHYLNEKLTLKKFLKDYKVENLDFHCMSEGLDIKKTIDRTKYQCLKKCSDFLKLH